MTKTITLSLFGACIAAMFAANAYFAWTEGFWSGREAILNFASIFVIAGLAWAFQLGVNLVIKKVRSCHGAR